MRINSKNSSKQKLLFLDNGVMWNGVPAVKAGAIVIERKLDKAALGIYPTSPFFIGYIIAAALFIILYTGRKKWFTGIDDMNTYKKERLYEQE